jgi:hypothetical protein
MNQKLWGNSVLYIVTAAKGKGLNLEKKIIHPILFSKYWFGFCS